VDVPDPCTPAEWCIAMLQSLGDPSPRKRRKSTLAEQVGHMTRQCQVRLIVVDNLQDVPARRRARGIELVGGRLRDLIDFTRCVWLFLGTHAAKEVIDREDQLIKRVAYRDELLYFSLETPELSREWLILLKRIDEWLPLAESNEKFLQSNSGLLFIASEGVLDRLITLLDRACRHAVEEGRERLSMEDLELSFRTVFGRNVTNPFDKEFVPRHLNQEGEPYQVFARKSDPQDALARGKRRKRKATSSPPSQEESADED
jgi:hypothetical protein